MTDDSIDPSHPPIQPPVHHTRLRKIVEAARIVACDLGDVLVTRRADIAAEERSVDVDMDTVDV